MHPGRLWRLRAKTAACFPDRGHGLAEFSGYGPWVHTAAPGVDLSVAVGKAGYRSWSGTSFS
jgi:subtilisin family serine protease